VQLPTAHFLSRTAQTSLELHFCVELHTEKSLTGRTELSRRRWSGHAIDAVRRSSPVN